MDVHECTLNCKPAFTRIKPSANYFQQKISQLRHKLFDLDIEEKNCKAFFSNRATLIREEIKRCEKFRPTLVMHPFSLLSQFWEVMFLMVWRIKIYGLPIIYMTRSTGNYAYRNLRFTYYILSVVQLLTIIAGIFRGYIISEEEKVVIAPISKLVKHNLKGFFIVDILAVFFYPVYATLALNFSLYNIETYMLKVQLIELFLHLLRIFDLIKLLKSNLKRRNFARPYITLINHFFLLSSIINMFAAFLYFIPLQYYGTLQNNPLLKKIVVELPIGTGYRKCMLIVSCYFFGISHDYAEVEMTPIVELIISIISLIGRLYTLFLIADLLEVFGWISKSQSSYEQIIDDLKCFSISRNLPERLKNRLMEFYDYKLRKRVFDKILTEETMNERLRAEVFIFGVKSFMKFIPPFQQMPSVLFSKLLLDLNTGIYLVGDFVLKEGDDVLNIYFISAGTIAIFDKDGFELSHITDGNDFGYESLFKEKQTQKFYYVAVETTEVFYISIKQFLDIFKNYMEVITYFENKAVNRKINLSKNVDFERTTLAQLRNRTLLEKRKLKPRFNLYEM